MELNSVERRIVELYRKKKRYSPDAKPPQKQCKDKDAHQFHNYPCDKGLIWSCQGRGPHSTGSKEVVRSVEDTVSKAAGVQALGGSSPFTSA